MFPIQALSENGSIWYKTYSTYYETKISSKDMFWTSPDVRLGGGAYPTTADVHEHFAGKTWQRWSRHTQCVLVSMISALLLDRLLKKSNGGFDEIYRNFSGVALRAAQRTSFCGPAV
jgi:hypothetical protein